MSACRTPRWRGKPATIEKIATLEFEGDPPPLEGLGTGLEWLERARKHHKAQEAAAALPDEMVTLAEAAERLAGY